MTLGTNPNYDVTKTDSTLTVNKAVATVVADAKSKFYGAANPALTAVVTGEVTGGDAVDYTLATTPRSTLSGVGSYPIDVTLGTQSELRRDQDRQHADGQQGGGDGGGRMRRASSTARRIRR